MPAWVHNLRADPAVTVEHGGARRPFHAREVDGDECDRDCGAIVTGGLPGLRGLPRADRPAHPAVRARPGRAGGRLTVPAPLRQGPRPSGCRTSRSSGSTTRRRRAPRSASSASAASPSTSVDLRKRPMAPGELRRFVERLGARALLDETSRAYRDAGLAYLSAGRRRDRRATARATTGCCALPLVRHGNEVTAGKAEATWARWLKPPGVGRRRQALTPSSDPADDQGAADDGPRSARRP